MTTIDKPPEVATFLRNIPEALKRTADRIPQDVESKVAYVEANVARHCGACTLCCKTFYIRDLKKPDGVWCPYAKKGCGCVVQATKPFECKEFFCLWLLGWFEEADRPDHRAVVFCALAQRDHDDLGSSRLDTYLKTSGARPVGLRQQFDGAWARPQTKALVDQLLAHGIPVIVYPAGAPVTRTILYPEGCGGGEERFEAQIVDPVKMEGTWLRIGP